MQLLTPWLLLAACAAAIWIAGVRLLRYGDATARHTGAHGSAAHAVSAISGVTMTGVALVGMLYRPRVRLFKLVGWVSLALFSLYLLNAYVLYLFRA
jgi:hypothetical protein